MFALKHIVIASLIAGIFQTQKRLRSWARRGGEFLVATDARHNFHADDPGLVISAIRRLLDAR